MVLLLLNLHLFLNMLHILDHWLHIFKCAQTQTHSLIRHFIRIFATKQHFSTAGKKKEGVKKDGKRSRRQKNNFNSETVKNKHHTNRANVCTFLYAITVKGFYRQQQSIDWNCVTNAIGLE